VSSHDRRRWNRGAIQVLELEVQGKGPGTGPGTLQSMKRVGEPADLFLAPHGIDLRTIQNRTYLYVISHGKDRDLGPHAVVIYEVKRNELLYRTAIRSPTFTSPNDL